MTGKELIQKLLSLPDDQLDWDIVHINPEGKWEKILDVEVNEHYQVVEVVPYEK